MMKPVGVADEAVAPRGDDKIVPASGAARATPEVSRGFRVCSEVFIRARVTSFTFSSAPLGGIQNKIDS